MGAQDRFPGETTRRWPGRTPPPPSRTRNHSKPHNLAHQNHNPTLATWHSQRQIARLATRFQCTKPREDRATPLGRDWGPPPPWLGFEKESTSHLSGKSKWGLKLPVHNCPRLPTIVVILRRKFLLERGPKVHTICRQLCANCRVWP